MSKVIRIHRDSTRDIVDDSVFGRLSYIKDLGVTPYDTKGIICRRPFESVEIKMDGKVNICCGDWLPVSIGNLHEDSIVDIWQSKKVNIIRDTINDGSYKYCNLQVCEDIKYLYNRRKKDQPILKYPRSIHMAVDVTCNLACPSCRTDYIKTETTESMAKIRSVLDNIFSSVTEMSHSERITIYMDGAGEIFSSSVYRDFFKNHRLFNNNDSWPNIDFVLNTNGTLLTPKIQKMYSSLLDKTSLFCISVDAGNKDTYESVRVGGDWDMLMDNLQYLYEDHLIKKNKPWQWNFIVQKNNILSLPDLIRKIQQFKEKPPFLRISNLVNWGSYTEEEYLENAIWLPGNPEHQTYKDIMNDKFVSDFIRKK